MRQPLFSVIQALLTMRKICDLRIRKTARNFCRKAAACLPNSQAEDAAFFCTAAFIKKRQGSVVAVDLRDAENVFCAMRRFEKS